MTHDYRRNGITCLSAGTDFLEGRVIDSRQPRHGRRHRQEGNPS